MIKMKKTLMMLSVLAVLTTAVNVQAATEDKSEASTQEVAASTNGFDSVNVCQLLSWSKLDKVKCHK